MNHGANADVVTEYVSIPTWKRDFLLANSGRADLLVLPRAVRDGRGEYPAPDLPAVKALRAAGVSIDWAHPAPERTFASEYSAEVAVVIGLFVAQALGQEAVVQVSKWLLARVQQALAGRSQSMKRSTLVIEVDRLKVVGDRREVEGLRVTGTDERVVAEAASLLCGGPPLVQEDSRPQ